MEYSEEDLNQVLMELVKEGLVEMSWDSEKNDFVFWWDGDKEEE